MDTPIIDQRTGAMVTIQGQPMVDYAANDYLGLSQHPVLKAHMADAVHRLGLGSTGSRRLSGNHQVCVDTEAWYADWLGKEAGVLFSSGYQMNAGLFHGLFDQPVTVIADKRIHASLIRGVLDAGIKLVRFRHNDMAHLERCLATYSATSQCIILCESVYSMDADSPDLTQLVALKRTYGAQLMIDEAHSIGIMGPDGRGWVHQHGAIDDVDYILLAFGKAMGLSGGMVLTRSALAQRIRTHCPSYRYSTALPLPVVSTLLRAGPLVASAQDARCQLQQHGQRVNQVPGVQATESPIKPLIIGDANRTNQWAHQLMRQGLHVRAIHHPTVPQHQSRLRITLTASHTHQQVSHLIQALHGIMDHDPSPLATG